MATNQGYTCKEHRNVIANQLWLACLCRKKLKFFFNFFFMHTGNAMMTVAPDVTVKFNRCTGLADLFTVQPTWFVNGKIAKTERDC